MYKMILKDYCCHVKSSFIQMYNHSGFFFVILFGASIGYDDINDVSYMLMVFPSIIAYIMSRMYCGLINKTLFLCPLDTKTRRQYAIESFRLRIIIPLALFLVGNVIAMIFGYFAIDIFLVRLFVFMCTAISVNIYAQPHTTKDKPYTNIYPFIGNYEVISVYSHAINFLLTLIVIVISKYTLNTLSMWVLISITIALIIQLTLTISMVKRFYWQTIALLDFYK